MKKLIPILLITVPVIAGEMLGITIQPMLDLNLPSSKELYAIQATTNLCAEWVTITNVPSGTYRGLIADDAPGNLFFRIQYVTNSIVVPKSKPVIKEVSSNAKAYLPPMPNS